ncbi:MAG: cadmium-translocating P-type ATPase [Promicromonosporaceae bacterium]|nr:cadmium-translocating P-type ATPase [Promicromonosporaceae bacterium]
MSRVIALAKSYPLVVITIVVGIVNLILLAFGQRFLTEGPFPHGPMGAGLIGAWLIYAWCVFIALKSLWQMIQEARQGNFGLDILAVTAIGATLAVGEYWAALVIVLMVTGGEALEDYADGRAKRDLTSLVSNAPQTAHRLTDGGRYEDIPVGLIDVGDQLLVRAHEVVPVDGTLLSPTGSFDESSLTGEAMPREMVEGEEVYSGVICGSQAVTIQATRAAAESQYQQIVSMVSDAAASRSPMVRLADRYAVPFTAVAFAIAGFAWWYSGDPMRFAQVLVVATPCPLLIAAPVAFMSGMSRAARRGLIIRSSATLEKLRGAKSFAFDKTGTLTKGRPELISIRPTDQFTDGELLALAATAEQGSAHILAEAIIAGAASRQVALGTPTDVAEDAGGGIRARVSGHDVVIGKRSYVIAQTGAEPPALSLAPGEVAVTVAVDGAYAGALVMRDQVRPEAHNTLRALEANGVRHIAMFTGDELATAEYIAEGLGIRDVNANCLPADKLHGVQAMQPRPVVMVGDGVNDAPVLAAADVGIAMAARGSTAASESADVVVLPDDISRVAEAQQIGSDTVRVALQAIWIGIIISVGLMLFAATGRLPAVVGAWLQEVVDVISILWALRAGGRFLARRRGLDHISVFTGPPHPSSITASTTA